MPFENADIMVINPGSTSTKISLFAGDQELMTENINHKIEELSRFNKASDQDLYRMEIIIGVLKAKKVDLSGIRAVVGRGGLVRPIEGGTYIVNEAMIRDLKKGVMGDHPSNCGGLIAYAFGKSLGTQSFIVDPVVVDELDSVARISGMPLIARKSIFHALNQKAVAREVAAMIDMSYNKANIIVAHMGGGISVGCHAAGKVIDVNNGLDGDGPFSAERSGSVPVGDLIKACYSGEYTMSEMKKLVKGHGGVVAYLGTHDMRIVEQRIEQGDEKAKLIYQSMAYQVAREIGALATVVKGKVDAIALTGGMANSTMFIGMIKERIEFLAPVYLFPGEQEMRALALGALRVLNGEEAAKNYQADQIL